MEQEFLLAIEKLNLVTDEVPVEIWHPLKIVVENSFVPKIEAGNFRPLEESDFNEIIPIIEINLKNILIAVKAIKATVDKANCQSSRNIQKNFVVSVLLLCGEHRYRNLWTSEASRNISNEILELLEMMKGCNYAELFVGGEDLMKHCLVALRPKLLKDTFKYYPAAVSCYKWLLFQVKPSGSQLNDPVSYLLPTALILVDDFMTENQIIGLECIQHIMTLTNSTELSWHGEGEMAYKAVEQVLYFREPDVIVPAYSCMVDILKCMKGTSKAHHIITDWSKYDNVFEIIFRSMELESSVRLKILYLHSLKKLLDAAGPRVIRWTKRFLTILKDYLEVAGHSEYSLGLPTLECLVLYLKHVEARAGRHAEELFNILFRTLYDFTHANVSEKQTEGLVINLDLQKTTLDLLLHCIYKLKPLNPVVSKQISEHSIPEGIYGEMFEKAFHDLFSEP